MIKKKRHIILDAFTIFEVTVVLAIMSVLITIISFSLNRFNEQLKMSNDIGLELNQWRAIRSTLWREFYFSDSITIKNNILSIYSFEKEVNYKVDNDILYRKNNSDWNNLKLETEAIYEVATKDSRSFNIDFMWKNEIMTLSYPYNPTANIKINEYFNQLSE